MRGRRVDLCRKRNAEFDRSAAILLQSLPSRGLGNGGIATLLVAILDSYRRIDRVSGVIHCVIAAAAA